MNLDNFWRENSNSNRIQCIIITIIHSFLARKFKIHNFAIFSENWISGHNLRFSYSVMLIKSNDLNCLFDIFIVLYEEQFCLVYICRCRINSLPLQQTSHRHSCVTNAVSGTLAYLNLTQSCLSQNNIFLEWPEMRAKNDTWIFIR